MKTIAIIGASYLQLPLYLKARQLGIKTIGFAWVEGAVAKDYCDVFYPISIINKEEILVECKKEKINGILTIASDVAVPTVNYIANELGLIGNSNKSALWSTNKFLMRQKFDQAGLLCPKYFLVDDILKLQNILKTLRYPLIVKPVDRSGSKGITKIMNDSELEEAVKEALNASFAKQAIIEEFIEGQEVSVEMISYKGNHYELTITDKETSGAPHFVELAHHQPSLLDKNIQNKIYEESKKGLNALEIKYGASHPEFIISNGEVYITEIGARMGGDFIGSNLVELSTGFDFLKGVIDISLDNFEVPQKTIQKSSGVYFYSIHTPQVEKYIENKNQYPFIFQAEISSNKLIPLTQSADRTGYFIYQANNKILI